MTTDLHALVAAYALDALDDDERVAFEAHLGSCPTCPGELAEFTEVVGELADATSSPAPGGVRDRVLAQLGETEQVPAPPVAVPTAPIAPTEPTARSAMAALLSQDQSRPDSLALPHGLKESGFGNASKHANTLHLTRPWPPHHRTVIVIPTQQLILTEQVFAADLHRRRQTVFLDPAVNRARRRI